MGARTGTVIVGIGNPERGDDAAGLAVLAALRASPPAGLELCAAAGAADILDLMEEVDAAYLVDACRSGAASGTIHRFDVHTGSLPLGTFGVSTHGLGLGEAIELARALDRLPRCCIVYAIEGGDFALGAPLTPAVAEAARCVAARIGAELTQKER
jgi:hydrogenase maturation protease